MAGGVALNCVAVGKIIKENIFKKFGSSQLPVTQVVHWVALAYWHIELKKDRVVNKEFKDSMKGSLLGYKEPTDIIRKN